jgi:peptidoglycan hydrolase-like protein with peptidoglycan-binding domain
MNKREGDFTMKKIIVLLETGFLIVSFSTMLFSQTDKPVDKEKSGIGVKMHEKQDIQKNDKQQQPSKAKIEALQNALIKAGFLKGTASGVMDQATTDAITAYQKANNLEVTGRADHATKLKLGLVHENNTAGTEKQTVKEQTKK